MLLGAPLLVVVAASVISCIITWQFASHAQDADIQELNAKVDELNGQLDDYYAGVDEAKSTSRSRMDQESVDAASEGGDAEISTPENTTKPFEKDGIIVVNKKHPLPKAYAPGENAEAVAALRRLIAQAKSDGIDIIDSYSGYRSFSTQAGLYNSYAAADGVAKADTYSARPGYSEHQTGLAFDLKDSTGNLYKINDAHYNYATDWVALNAAKYGFIVRYRDETTPITGYSGEPWHLRYLGVDLANKVYDSGKTLEEYLGVDGGDYN